MVGQPSHLEAGGQLLSRFRPKSIRRRVLRPCRGVPQVLPRGISRQRQNRESAAPIWKCRWHTAFLRGCSWRVYDPDWCALLNSAQLLSELSVNNDVNLVWNRGHGPFQFISLRHHDKQSNLKFTCLVNAETGQVVFIHRNVLRGGHPKNLITSLITTTLKSDHF